MSDTTTFNDNTNTDNNKQRLNDKRTNRATHLKHKNKGGWIQKLFEDNQLVSATKRFLETIGSIDTNCKTMNFIDIPDGPLSKHVHQFHDGREFDSNDCARFQEINATNGTKNIKGSSAKGYGLRLVMAQLNAYKIGKDIKCLLEEKAIRKNLTKLSFIVTKITEPIEITDKETGITNKYTSDDGWLILTVVTNQTDTWLKDNFAIGDVEYDTKLAIMKELVKYPDAKCHTFYYDLKGKNRNYKCLAEQIDCNFKGIDEIKTSADELIHAIRFITSGKAHKNLTFNINNRNLYLYDAGGGVHVLRKGRIVDKVNGLPYLKVRLIGFSKDKKHYLKVTIYESGFLKNEIPVNEFYLYIIGRDQRKDFYKLDKGGIKGFNQILLDNWKTNDIPCNYEISDQEKTGEWEMDIHSFDKHSEPYKKLAKYYGAKNLSQEGVVIEMNNCMCNPRFFRNNTDENKIDCCDFFSNDDRGIKGFNDGKYDYANGQKMHVVFREISATKTIININSDKANTKLLRIKDCGDGYGGMIQFVAPCLWREYLTDRSLKAEKPKVEKTKYEVEKEKTKKLEQEKKEMKMKYKKEQQLLKGKVLEQEKDLKVARKVSKKLENENKKFQEENKKLSNENKKVKAQVVTANERLQETEVENEKILVKVKKVSQDVTNVQMQVEETNKENKKLQGKLVDKDNKIKEVLSDLSIKEDQLNKAQAKIKHNDGITGPESIKITMSAVYFFTDPSRPRWFKVGWTKDTFEKLKKQSRYGPNQFPIGLNWHSYKEINTFTMNDHLAEQLLHNRYYNLQINKTEWFKIPDNYDVRTFIDDTKGVLEQIQELLTPI